MDFSVGRLLENRGGDRCAVAQPIDEIRVLAAAFVDRDAARDPAGDVWMLKVNTAIDDGNADPSTRLLPALSQGWPPYTETS